MTLYAKQTWADNDISKPLSAARMSHLEDGVYDVSAGASTLITILGRNQLIGADGSAGGVAENGIVPAWSMPDAANSSIVGIYRVPPDAVKLDVAVRYWCRGSGGANACLRFDYEQITDGTALSTGLTTGTKIACPLGAQYVPATAVLQTDLAVTGGALLAIKIYRLPGDALDTNSGDAIAVGAVRLTPKVA